MVLVETIPMANKKALNISLKYFNYEFYTFLFTMGSRAISCAVIINTFRGFCINDARSIWA